MVMKEYKCETCGKKFDVRQSHWRHIHQKKKPCVPNASELEFREAEDKSRLLELEVKTLQQKLAARESDNLEETISSVVKKQLLTVIEEKNGNEQKPATAVFNNCVINTLNQNNKNKNLNFSIQLAPHDKERYDHISNDQILHILSNDDFTNSVGDLAEAVYFNPKAPENIRWCVTDNEAQYGAIVYNQESCTLQRAMTKNVITKNLMCLVMGLSDKVEEVRNTNVFTAQQAKNYSRFYDMIGIDDFEQKHINKIKERAYDSRDFTQAFWGQIRLRLETKTMPTRRYVKKN